MPKPLSFQTTPLSQWSVPCIFLAFSWNETLTLSHIMEIPGYFSTPCNADPLIQAIQVLVPNNQRYQSAFRYHRTHFSEHRHHSCSHLWGSLLPTAPDLSHIESLPELWRSSKGVRVKHELQKFRREYLELSAICDNVSAMTRPHTAIA